MAMDRIAGEAHLFLGDLLSARQNEALRNAHITHVLSALRPPMSEHEDQGPSPDGEIVHDLKRLVIEIDDLEDEDVIQHFPVSNAFIQGGLDSGGGVLVHCASGISRSPTLLAAYLLNHNPGLTPSSALALIRQTHLAADPNEGFRAQLTLYHSMQCPPSPADHPVYQRWLYQRHVTASISAGTAPAQILFRDEKAAPDPPRSPPATTFRCRRCRTQLATSHHLTPHASPSGQPPCAHLFLDQPLRWMRPELEKARLDGRFECPNARCAANVGKYAWQGLRCSCGIWVVPAVCIARGRVDESRG